MRTRTLATSLVVLAAACAAALAPAAPAATPLRTGFIDPGHFASGDPAVFERARAAGSSVVRLVLHWNEVAPSTRTPGFDPANPAEPRYDWASIDRQVRLARAWNLDVLLTIVLAPPWAEGSGAGPSGSVRPSVSEFGTFARAAALRYSGRFAPPGDPGDVLPRVRYWQAWNEPNRDNYLMPQYAGGRIVSASHYRYLVRSFSAAVHGVNASNLVVAGGLAPLGRTGKPAPMAFMRKFFCVSRALRRTCELRRDPLRIDVWSHHPYTSGSPTHHAAGRDNVSLGDLPQMRRLLRAAARLGQVRGLGGVRFWVTEFSWDSQPPDPQGLPSALHARWTSEALYRMWKAGVSLVTWWRLQDDPLSASPFQSGLYTADGAAKPSRTAFRFPVVAFRHGRSIAVWGRTPTGRSAPVSMFLRKGGAWRLVASSRANQYGIFSRTIRVSGGTSVRARVGKEYSLPFSLARVRDRYVNPFGCGGSIQC